MYIKSMIFASIWIVGIFEWELNLLLVNLSDKRCVAKQEQLLSQAFWEVKNR